MPAPSAPPSSDVQPIRLPAPPVAGDGTWRVHVYAHTHWDREWYRSFERFRMQLVGVVDRVLDALDSDPAFATFVLDGQTIVLEDYLAIRPEEEPRIRRLVGAGRLEVGPWHVLPDEFLVSGESLIRNLHEGRRVAARFGTPLAVGYLPDPFGHVAQLPAILRGFGIDNAIFSRGMGDEHARTGNEFRWESPSGVDVLALVQGSPYTSGYCNAELLGRGNTADDASGYERVAELAPFLAVRASGDAMLLAAGCDHETVQEQLPRVVERLAQLLPDADVRITGLAAYVASVRDAERRSEAAGQPFERHRGELRGSLHAPILTSIFSARIPLKQDNDRLQSLLETHVEPLMALAVAAGVRPARDVEPFLRHAWRLVLENHPHDSIGGCSVDAVHDEMPARTLRALAVGHSLVEDLRVALGLGEEAVVHDGVGFGGIAARADGSPVAIAPGPIGRLVPLDGVVRDEGAEVVDPQAVRAGALEARVIDRDGRRVLEVATGERAVTLDWIDVADAGDEYDFGALADDRELVATLTSAEATIAGPGVAELAVQWELDLPVSLDAPRAGRAVQTRPHVIFARVRVSTASPLAQLAVEFTNEACDHRLRLRAAVDGLEPSDQVEALGHLGQVARRVRHAPTATPWRQAPTELDHCHGAVRAGDVLLAGRGIHEYEADAGRLELTVLRSVGWLSRSDIAGRPGHAGPALATPGGQCLGPHRVELAVGVGAGASFDAARAFLAPPLLLEPFGIEQSQRPGVGLDSTKLMESGAIARARDVLRVTPDDPAARIASLGVELGGDGDAVHSALKLADDGSGDLVVRWWVPASAPAPAVAWIRLTAPVRSVLRCRLDETPQGPAPFEGGATLLRIDPGAIATVRIAIER
ncbi:MAG: glycoside hydrolase, family 38 [Thermoleophilia bacterium]|nr:glycoside hydrolase, family 38 [Thermoleophilia bacterium]